MAADEDIPVDEGLFVDDDDEEEEGETPHEGEPPHEDNPTSQAPLSSEEVGVAVDESLFDLDNLQDLNLNDPAILDPPPTTNNS